MLELTYPPNKHIKSAEKYYAFLHKAIKKHEINDEQEYCFYEYMDGCREIYEAILDICCRHGIREVHDIGCCYAMQAPMFAEKGKVYLGIEVAKYMEPYVPRGKNIYYRFTKYPDWHIPVITKSWHTAAISSLCVGYLCKGEEVWCCMASNHEYFIGVLPESEIPAMKRYYKTEKVYHMTKYIDILFCKRRAS